MPTRSSQSPGSPPTVHEGDQPCRAGTRLDTNDGASDTGSMSGLALRSRFALEPLIGEARRRARRRRLLTATVLALLIGGALLAARPLHGPPATGSSASAATVSDGLLRATLPLGWSASVGHGFYRTHPEAWVLLGDFRLPHGAARQEGAPSVPAGSALVTIGDFFPEGASRHWGMVTSLRMPRALIVSGRWWSVRYAGRAVSIKVTFGSGATQSLVDHVQRLLRRVHRIS